MKLNICIDIDGTITDPYHFIPYLNEMCSKNISPTDCITHKWEDLYDIGIDDILNKFHTSYMYSYKEADVVEDAKDIIEALCKEHNIYFVTARSEVLTEITTTWLNEKGFANIDVHLLGSDYKIDKARELSCNIFIEDNPSNAMQLAQEGMTVLLIDTNYNKNIEHKNIIRVNNWIEIKEVIENYK
ncbi:MAG: hydrolase [Romboutsia sp.]